MTRSSRPESIRIHLSIRPGSAAYEALIKCETLAARRAAAQDLMQLAASVLQKGLSALAASGVAPPALALTASPPASTAFTAEASSDVDAILRLDFNDL